MQQIIDFIWQNGTDGLITTFLKNNVILVALAGAVIRYFVKRSPSTEDDALLEDIRRVIPQLRRK